MKRNRGKEKGLPASRSGGARLRAESYRDWFDKKILWPCFESGFPWTRLGDAWDRSGGDSEYGRNV